MPSFRAMRLCRWLPRVPPLGGRIGQRDMIGRGDGRDQRRAQAADDRDHHALEEQASKEGARCRALGRLFKNAAAGRRTSTQGSVSNRRGGALSTSLDKIGLSQRSIEALAQRVVERLESRARRRRHPEPPRSAPFSTPPSPLIPGREDRPPDRPHDALTRRRDVAAAVCADDDREQGLARPSGELT